MGAIKKAGEIVEKAVFGEKKFDVRKVVNDIITRFKNLPVLGSIDMDMWAMNWALYKGRHNLAPYSKGKGTEVVDRHKSMSGIKHRSKINIITTYTDIAVAKLLKQQPQPQCIPMSSDSKDEKAADVGTALLKHAYGQSKLNLTDKTYEVLSLSKVMGTGWWKIMWDKDAGDLFEGQRVGDYKVGVYDNFQVFPDPTARDYFDLQHVWHVYLVNKNVTADLYADKLDGKTLPDMAADADTKRRYLSDQLQQNGRDQVLVTEYWERPSKKYEKGRKVVILNENILVEDGPNPYSKYGDYCMPFFPFYWKKDSDDIYGTCTFNDLVNIQKEINSIASLIMESIRKMATLKWFAPKGSGISGKDLDGGVGNVIEYNPIMGQGINQGNPAPLPAYTSNHLSFLMGAAQDVEKLHEISMGQLPERGSQMSGSALKLLMDSEQVTHSPSMRKLKATLKMSSEFIIRLARDKMIEPRVISIVGKSKGYAIKEFVGDTDLDGNVDVMIQIGSAFDTSIAAKLEGSLNLWDRQIPQAAMAGDKSARQLLDSLEYGTVDWHKIDEMTKARAHEDLKVLLDEGLVTEIYKYDDHQIYIDVYNEYRLTEEFSQLSPKKQKAIIAALETRHELLQKKQALAEGVPGEEVPAEGIPQDASQIDAAMGQQQPQ